MRSQTTTLERFPVRWKHLTVKKSRQTNSLERRSDSIRSKTALALAASLIACSLPAFAQIEAPLHVKDERTLSTPRAIGRVEVDREGVIAIAAPSPRSLRLTALGEGEATVSVYAGDGALITRSTVRVAPDEAASAPIANSPIVRAGEQVVAVDVQFAAVSSTTLKALGFNFSKLSGDIQGAIVSPSSLTSASFTPQGLALEAAAPIQNAFNLFLSAPNRGIGAVLSALSSNGLSQLLAQPTLLVRSGEQASFLTGGEFPVPVPQASGGGGTSLTIQYKEFGVRLSVTPFVLSKDHIVLKIAPEVSELDYNNGVQLQGYVVPGLRRRSAETTVELGSGQSFVIAGLSYSNQSVTREKTPFLGDIPVLGAFFKRQQNQKEKQELIIVATPRLVAPVKAEELPPLPGAASAAVDPSIGDMIVGSDGLGQSNMPFGVVRR